MRQLDIRIDAALGTFDEECRWDLIDGILTECPDDVLEVSASLLADDLDRGRALGADILGRLVGVEPKCRVTVVSALMAALAVEKAPAKTEAKTHTAAKHETKKVEEGKEVTMTGKVVDLANYTTGTSCSDHAKCAECIKSGVPCALETSKGIILLGKGHKGCGEILAEHASMEVREKGKLYEKGGIKYLDIESVDKMGTAAATTDAKKVSSATESHRNVRIYPPGELSKMQSKTSSSAKTHTTAVAMAK